MAKLQSHLEANSVWLEERVNTTIYNHTGYFFWSKTTGFLEWCHSIRNNCCPRKQMLQANVSLWLLARKQGECDDSRGKVLFNVSVAEFKLWRDSGTVLYLWRLSPDYGNFQQQKPFSELCTLTKEKIGCWESVTSSNLVKRKKIAITSLYIFSSLLI